MNTATPDHELNLRAEIFNAITEMNDPKDRANMAFVLRVLDRVEKLLADEDALRLKVFNGDYPNHSDHHVYVKALSDRNALAAIDFVNDRMEHGGYCKYANAKMLEEDAAKKTMTSRWNKMIEGLVSELPKIAIYAILTLLGMKWILP